MTREEKINTLQNWCNDKMECPENCPIHASDPTNASVKCLTFYLRTDAEIDKALAAIGAVSSEPDNVNHPKHYELPGGLECFDVLIATQGKEAAQHFCLCNAMKYLFRQGRKNGREDIEKARWYLDKYLELTKEEKA